MEIFYPDYDEKKDLFRIDEEDRKRLEEILGEDYGAVFINGYYDNIGSMEEMTVASLADGLAFQYQRKHTMLCDCM